MTTGPSRCMSAPSPTASGFSATPTPTPWAPGTTSPPRTRTPTGLLKPSRCTDVPSPTASGFSATPTPGP